MLRKIGILSLFLLAAAGAQAQSYTYHVYIDADLRDTTGCTVTGGGQTFAGADYRLTATVTGTPAVVSGRTLSACSAGSFGAGSTLSAGYPVGLNNGLSLGAGAFADVIEVAVGRGLMPGVQPQVRVGFAAESASGSLDILYTANGQVGGPPMIVGLPQLIPTLGFVGALLLALVLVGVALRTLKRNRALAQMLLLGAFFSAGLAAWAANFIADGQVSDWANSSPIGSDPSGDPVPPLAATDIVAAFGADEASTLFFRLDVVDVENRPPVANNDAYTTTEDTLLTIAAPGVLGNDSDPEGNPITAQLVTGPTRGTLTLNANGGFTYTPNANANGTDTFTYNAFDGQVPSQTPGTVTITITPVNDVPVFTAGPNQTVLEDAGAQTVNPWATGVSDGDPEATQNLSFNVTGNTNPALFSAGPAISATGALTYTPAANANGTATITLTLSDDGGTANGGVDTSAPQSFTITVTAVNDAPSFTAGANQTVNEDAGAQTVTPWATAISPGPADEAGQTVSFNVTGNTNPALFSTAPAVSPTGTLTYTPAANAVGSATITLTLQDNGGTANGGIDTSAPQTFTITVTGVNDAPVFTAGPNQTVLEDAGAQTVNPWATGIDDGDPEVTQTLSFNVTGNTNAALFSVAPAISPTGVLTYTPAADANGVATITLTLSDNGGTANGGVDTSAPQNFTITVTAVNDAPSFTASNPPTVNEDAAAVSIPAWASFNPGPADESGQTVLGYTVSAISNPALFATAPAVANNGTLSYTLAPNQNGSSTFTVRVQDSGGTANGGVDLSATQTFTVTVTGINDAPSFTAGANQTVLEDAGAQTVNPWATAINDGDPEVTQTLTFNVTGNTNPTLFSAAPAISPTGVLTYTPAANANGVATITLTLSDNGGTANGGVDTSAPQNFTITVTAVNDAPSFTKGADQSVNEDVGPQTVNPWATAISPGPADEAAQTVSFSVTGNTNAGLFSTAPAISPTGVLTYTLAVDTSGSATITLVAIDSGSGVAPNVNTSAAQTFVITVNAVNDAPVNTVPAAQNTGDTVPLVLSTANTNAISVADVDAAAGIVQMSFGTGAPANGTLTLANPGGVLSSLTGNGTELVIATGTLTALNTALNGPSGSLTYTPVAGTTATRTITVITNDQGNTGSGGAQIDTDLISVNVDAPPVVTSTPANGATIANNATISVNFSESVNVIAGITLSCGGGPNLITGGSTGAGVTTLNLSYTAPLPAGSCTLSVPAASVSDVDAIDPPNNPAANYTATFTVDAAPAVTTTTPSNGSTAGTTTAITVNFSEPVNVAAGGVSLNCGAPVSFSTGLPASNITSLVLTPATALAEGANCNATVQATLVTDVDGVDPPDQMSVNYSWNFSIDTAPVVSSASPVAGAVVPTTQVIAVNFSENVNLSAGAFTLNCGANVPFTSVPALPATATSSIALTPTSGLASGSACTLTAIATEVSDSDANDPPDTLSANFVRNFSVDSAPAVTTTTPANGGALSASADIAINFSEPVNFAGSSFTLECPSATAISFAVSGIGSNSATLNPTGNLPVGDTCTVRVLAAEIADADGIDPPDQPVADHVFSFTAVNAAPVLTAGGALAYTENSPPSVIDGTITVSDGDSAQLVSASAQITGGYINGEDVLSFTNTANISGSFTPATGTLTLVGSDTLAAYEAALRNVRYANPSDTPTTAPRTLTWIASDGIASSSAVVSTITVSAVDDNPVAVADTATVNEDSGTSTVAVLANDTDVDGGPISIASVTQPTNGTVAIAGGGTSVTYAPNANYCNTPPGGALDTFTYTLNPGASATTVTVAVTCTDDNPLAVADSATVAEDSGATAINVLANDNDMDGGPRSISSVTQPTNGAVVITGGGTGLSYAPNPNYCNNPPGSTLSTFSYTLTPGGSSATVTVTVTCVDDSPVAVADSATITEDSGANPINVLANDTDIDGGPISISSVTQPANGVVVITGGGTGLTYAPNANYCNNPPGSSLSTFSYTLSPGASSATVTVQVNCVNDPPVATSDSFDTLGNTELRVDVGSTSTPSIVTATGSSSGVRHNDTDPVENDPFSVTGVVGCADVSAPFDCTLASGSLLTMNANGSFRFRPSPTLSSGAPTNDTFTYTITDTPAVGTAASANGTVTIRAYDKIWYVQQGAAGNGRSDNPLGSFSGIALGDGSDSDAPGDTIYVRTGGSTLNSSIVLEANQRLLGEGVALSTDRDLNGVTATINLVPAGTAPTISAGSGATVQIGNAVPVEIRGLALGATAGNAINLVAAAAVYTGSPTLTIANNQFTGASGDDIQVNTAATSLLTLTISDNVWSTSGSHGGNAIDIVNNSTASDSLRLDVSRNTNLLSAGTALLINGGAVARTTINGFAGNSVHGNSGAAGVLVSAVTFDATPGGAIQQVDGDALAVGQAGNAIGGVGANFGASQGSLRFDDLDLYGIGGLSVSGTGSGLTFAVADAGAGGSATIDAGTDFGVSANSVALDLRLVALTSSSAAASNVSLTSVSGQFGAATGSLAKTGGAAAAFVATNSAVSSNYAGTVTTTGGVSGINLSNNASSAFSFTGVLNIASGGNAGVSAVNSGTLAISDTSNVLVSTTGVALNVSGTSISAGGLRFRSISSNGAPSGIVLSGTGTLGGLTVSGNGGSCTSAGTCSGGAIQSSTADAIDLDNAVDISLSDMYLFSSAQSHIDASNVNRLTLQRIYADLSTAAGVLGSSVRDLTITGGVFDRGGAGSVACNVNGIEFNNLLGTSLVSGATFRRANTIQFRVNNTSATNPSGTPDSLAVTATDWNTHNNACAGDHLSVNADTGGNFRLDVNSSVGINRVNNGGTFATGGGSGVQATASGTGKLDVSVTGLKTQNNTAGVAIGQSGTGSVSYHIFGNKTANGTGFSDTGSGAIFVTHVSAGGISSGTIEDNSIVHSAGPSVNAMQVVIEGIGASGGTGTATISNNVINGNFQRGIQAQARIGTARLNLTMIGNQVNGTDVGGLQGINVETGGSGTGHGNTVCLNMSTNAVTMAGGLTAYRLRNGTTSSSCTITPCVFQLQNFAGAGNVAADVQTWISTTKTNSGTPTGAFPNYSFSSSAGCPTP